MEPVVVGGGGGVEECVGVAAVGVAGVERSTDLVDFWLVDLRDPGRSEEGSSLRRPFVAGMFGLTVVVAAETTSCDPTDGGGDGVAMTVASACWDAGPYM